MGWFHEIKQSKDQIKIRKGWITKCSSSSHPKKGPSLMSTQKAQRQKRLGIRGRAKMAKKQSRSNSYHHPFNKHHWSSIHRNHLQNQQQPLDRRSLSEHRMHDKEWKNTSDTRLWEKHGTENVMRVWMNAYYIGVWRMESDGWVSPFMEMVGSTVLGRLFLQEDKGASTSAKPWPCKQKTHPNILPANRGLPRRHHSWIWEITRALTLCSSLWLQ